MMDGMGSIMSRGMMGGTFGMLFVLLFWGPVLALLVVLVVWAGGPIQRR